MRTAASEAAEKLGIRERNGAREFLRSRALS